jgi:hypothetical protein
MRHFERCERAAFWVQIFTFSAHVVLAGFTGAIEMTTDPNNAYVVAIFLLQVFTVVPCFVFLCIFLGPSAWQWNALAAFTTISQLVLIGYLLSTKPPEQNQRAGYAVVTVSVQSLLCLVHLSWWISKCVAAKVNYRELPTNEDA